MFFYLCPLGEIQNRKMRNLRRNVRCRDHDKKNCLKEECLEPFIWAELDLSNVMRKYELDFKTFVSLAVRALYINCPECCKSFIPYESKSDFCLYSTNSGFHESEIDFLMAD